MRHATPTSRRSTASKRRRADANVSVKLTQMGLDIDEPLCVENLRADHRRAPGS